VHSARGGFRIRQRRKVDASPLEEFAYLELGDTVVEFLSGKDPASPASDAWQAGYRMMGSKW
jgi:hypothetical protein